MDNETGLVIQVKISQTERAVRGDLTICATARSRTGVDIPLGAGRPDPQSGMVEIHTAVRDPRSCHNLAIQRYIGRSVTGDQQFQMLSDLPAALNGQTIDFGALVVHDEPVCRVGDRVYFALPMALLDPATRPIRAPLDRTITKLEQEKLSADARARTSVQEELKRKDVTIEELRSIVTGRNEVSLKEFILHTRQQIDQATKAIESSGYTLGPLQMQLRVVPEAAGGFSLPKKEDLATMDGSRLSVLNLSFVQGTQSSRSAPETRVPDVIGYTESLARRKLTEAGLAVTVVRQSVSLDAHGSRQLGRIIQQIPGAGATVSSDDSVTLAVGI